VSSQACHFETYERYALGVGRGARVDAAEADGAEDAVGLGGAASASPDASASAAADPYAARDLRMRLSRSFAASAVRARD
jgi:hypothetical protein